MAGIGIGLLGAARITERAIVDPVRVTPQCRLTAIAARDQNRAEAYAKRYGVAEAFSSYDQVIAAESVDLVYIKYLFN